MAGLMDGFQTPLQGSDSLLRKTEPHRGPLQDGNLSLIDTGEFGA